MLRALRNLLVLALLAALLYGGGRALVRALASPETRIRWRIESMAEGFDDARARTVLAGIAPDFVDRAGGTTRDDVHSILAWTFLQETDDQGACLWSFDLDEDALAIEVAEDERSARVACRGSFFRRRGAERELRWDARIEGRMELRDDGWQWTELLTANRHELRR